jgi:dihydroneopterin aldolase
MPSDRKSAICRLNTMRFHAYHGVSDIEKETGGEYEVDCEYQINIHKAVATDSLENVVDYSGVYDVIRAVISDRKYNLVETLAQVIADSIIEEFPINWIRINVRKMNPPVTGRLDSFEVEIERER